MPLTRTRIVFDPRTFLLIVLFSCLSHCGGSHSLSSAIIIPRTQQEDEQRFKPLPDLLQWLPSQGVTVSEDDGALFVKGDGSGSRYQLTSPPIPVPMMSEAIIRMRVDCEQGNVGFGVLSGDQSTFLLGASYTIIRSSRELEYQVSTVNNRKIYLVFVNANTQESGNPESRFRIHPGTYAVESH